MKKITSKKDNNRRRQKTGEARSLLPASPGSALWAVMKAYGWDSVEAAGRWPLIAPEEGPHKFIPVFNTRDAAVKWAGGDENVAMLMPTTPSAKLNDAGE